MKISSRGNTGFYSLPKIKSSLNDVIYSDFYITSIHTYFFKIRDESVRVLLFNSNSRGKKSGQQQQMVNFTFLSYLVHPSHLSQLQVALVSLTACPHLILLSPGLLHHHLENTNIQREGDVIKALYLTFKSSHRDVLSICLII